MTLNSRAVAANTIVSYFNGIRISETDLFNAAEKSVYVVEIGEDDQYLDVPKEYASWDNYQVGNSFSESSCRCCCC